MDKHEVKPETIMDIMVQELFGFTLETAYEIGEQCGFTGDNHHEVSTPDALALMDKVSVICIAEMNQITRHATPNTTPDDYYAMIRRVSKMHAVDGKIKLWKGQP